MPPITILSPARILPTTSTPSAPSAAMAHRDALIARTVLLEQIVLVADENQCASDGTRTGFSVI